MRKIEQKLLLKFFFSVYLYNKNRKNVKNRKCKRMKKKEQNIQIANNYYVFRIQIGDRNIVISMIF